MNNKFGKVVHGYIIRFVHSGPSIGESGSHLNIFHQGKSDIVALEFEPHQSIKLFDFRMNIQSNLEKNKNFDKKDKR